MSENDCLFCNMASGQMQVPRLYEDDSVFVIRDINPRAPVHLLIIPKEHIASARDLNQGSGGLLAHMFVTAGRMAQQEGIAERGFRLTVNVGDEGGQSVYHLHLHVLGGARLGPEG